MPHARIGILVRVLLLVRFTDTIMISVTAVGVQSIILAALGAAALSAAHGIVNELTIGGTVYSGYLPYQDPYTTPTPERIVWSFPTAGNGPVEDVSSSDIVCNKAATAAPISATVAAGAEVEFAWTTWPDSHKGPVMTYLANCNGDCSAADPTTLDFFKIDEAGYDGTTWASDTLIAAGNKWTVTLPSDIAAGNYMLRHEILALHSAGTVGGAQFYPMCANLVITGGGSAAPTGVNFPGAYSATDPGIEVDIYNGLTTYTIPGPAVYTGGASVADPITTSAAAERSTTSAAVVPTTSAAVVEEPTTTAAVEATTTAVVEEPATTAYAEVPTTTAVPTAATTSIAKPTITAATTVAATAAPVATTAATTLLTLTRGTTTAAAAATTAKNASQTVNECLDAVNECIRSQQSAKGGAVDFSMCEVQRTTCYTL
ncbi:glycosyl hydrolase family 61-domain-containing protein [Tricharina praecox]|uniref:glycosyl hydrolase family 61-domain-containing protein n=1 Tax=Tricharina praecox TaxID=43433 RepID=UPI00221EF2B7|nr:glycosyl hydrolase family 61-domain-containing protein [Tricharina praecox]KAI5852062.1 glycosyl hydrolase family 61-domain-containing protein [Tricharina praecox]